MDFKLRIITFFFCLGSFITINAQEVLLPAGIPSSYAFRSKKSTETDTPPDTLELPFFDDFSGLNGLPNPKIWTDEFVFINNSYSRDPVTMGVATLDAIYSDGTLNGTTKEPFESDFLTSLPINLNYPGRKDIWLSFFYEPMGLGDFPEEWDSLTVEFFAPDSNRWETVWAAPGSKEDTFKQVFIPVRLDRFLKKRFQFRFKNFASLKLASGESDKNGNVDIWNIDYVYLDTARSDNVTALNDVSMISPLESILYTYEAIPWRHFPVAYRSEIKASIPITYRNNDTTIRNVTRILKITDLTYQNTETVNGGAVNVSPGVLNTLNFPYNYPFVFYNADSTVFEIKSYLVTEDLDYKGNDTVVRYQRFYNYYAYDDGSAENGYGLKGGGSANASLAYQFKTFNKDTLRGLDMYFNRTLGDYTRNYFNLAVWNHDPLLNRPGELIYSMAGVRPEYPDELNKFFSYAFDTILIVENTFYVGWIQTTEDLLNVGWDVWNNEQSKIFFNLGQEWVNTGFKGSLMIRPLMGEKLEWPVATREIPEMEFRVFPNPATRQFYLDLPEDNLSGQWSIGLFNLQGKLVYHAPAEHSHYVGDLPAGMYIVRLMQNGRFRAGSKLIIQH